MKFEEKLTKLRKQNAWSQGDLAEKLDVTRQTISKWELGQTVPDIQNMTKIAELFGTTVNDLCDQNVNTDYIKSNGEKNNSLKIVIIVIVLIAALLGIGLITLNKIYNRAVDQLNQKSVIEMFKEGSLTDIFDEVFGKITDGQQQIVNNIDGMPDLNKKSFNQKFKSFYFGSTRGFFMNDFIDEVIKSNQENPDNIISVKYNDVETSDENELRNFKKNLQNGKTYDISYEYDENGFIKKATINE